MGMALNLVANGDGMGCVLEPGREGLNGLFKLV